MSERSSSPSTSKRRRCLEALRLAAFRERPPGRENQCRSPRMENLQVLVCEPRRKNRHHQNVDIVPGLGPSLLLLGHQRSALNSPTQISADKTQIPDHNFLTTTNFHQVNWLNPNGKIQKS